MLIVNAEERHLSGVLEIYNQVIATTTAVYSEEPVTLESRVEWWRIRTAMHYPVLVALDDDEVLGFASFGDFRPWPCYRYTVEHSVHVRADARNRGIGTGLVKALFPQAAALGKHVMVGGIDADNAPSIHLHRKLGFEPVAHLREVGRKFDRWLDLVFVQRPLTQADRDAKDSIRGTDSHDRVQ
jgi:L-amino acid N-acyltransferase YncA